MTKEEKTSASLLKKFEQLRIRLDQIERDLDHVEDSCPQKSDTVNIPESSQDTVEQLSDEASEANFTELALEATGVIVLAIDAKERIIYFNQGVEDITGFSAADVVGRAVWRKLVPQEELGTVQLTFAELQTGAQSNRHQSSILSRDGNRHLIAWSNTAIPDSSGMIQYVVSTGLDITKESNHLADAGEKAEKETKDRQIREIRARLDLLSPRENEVLRLVVSGKPNKSVASQLEISIKTVEHHRSNLMKKMCARSIAELVRMTMLAGWS